MSLRLFMKVWKPEKRKIKQTAFPKIVSLSMILDSILEKLDRRKPMKRTHRAVVGSI